MTDEQVWEDLSRFAQAMKRGATVVTNDGGKFPGRGIPDKMDFSIMAMCGIKDIIEPPQKKIRPLNAEEWKGVAGCIADAMPPHWHSKHVVPLDYSDHASKTYALAKATCHPPGFPNDIRTLFVEE